MVVLGIWVSWVFLEVFGSGGHYVCSFLLSLHLGPDFSFSYLVCLFTAFFSRSRYLFICTQGLLRIMDILVILTHIFLILSHTCSHTLTIMQLFYKYLDYVDMGRLI